MTGLWTLSKREFLGYFYAPIAYVVGTAFLAVNGFSFWALMRALSDPTQPAEPGAVLRHFFGGTLLHWLMVFAVIALLAMRSVAEDRRSGNWEALLTTRLDATIIVTAKWLALSGFYVLLWGLTLFLLLIFRQYVPPGEGIELGPLVSSYLAIIAIGSVLLALGLCISALTSNQIVAAVATFALSMLWLMAGEVDGLQGLEDSRSSWFLLIDLRESLSIAARGEVLFGFYARQIALVLVLLAIASAIASRTRAQRVLRVAASVVLIVAGSSGAVLVDRHLGSWDVSAARVNSLEDTTRELLLALDEPLELILVRPTEEVFDSVHGELGRLLDRMQREQPLLRRRDVDPLDRPERVQEWAFELAISPQDLSSGGAVIVEQGGRHRVVDLLALASFAADDLGVGALSELRAEAVIREAIAEVIEGPNLRLCATIGHGELSPESGAQEANQHWQGARDRLQASGVRVESVANLTGRVLAGCDALVVMGPSSRFSADEILAFDAYLKAGGSALLAFRSLEAESFAHSSELRLALDSYGIELIDARVVDTSQELGESPEWMTYEGYSAHPIVHDFYRRRATVWNAPFSLRSTQESAEPLVFASALGWAESDVAGLLRSGARERDADDGGHLDVAMAAIASSGSRLVAIGSAESMSSMWSERGVGGNERFLVSAILWTLGRDRPMAIAGKKPEHLRLLMNRSDLRWAFVWSVVLLPLGFGLLGAILAFLRRREPQP